jgi:hypothetical protein
MVMRKHQRYFPVFSADGKLLPAFITVANGPVDPEAVAAGNEAVLRARFEDAAFFYKEDLKQQLADFRSVVRLSLSCKGCLAQQKCVFVVCWAEAQVVNAVRTGPVESDVQGCF